MNTYSFSNLGKLPVKGEYAAGINVRNESEYEYIENEIAKLNNPNASSPIDWLHICDVSAELLLNKGKDILVACYMTCGLLQTSGLAGLSDGFTVIIDMLETYWDTLYPPLTRLRARRNALEFLIDHIQLHAVESAWPTMAPQAPELIQILLTNAKAIDSLVQNHDSNAPSMQPIINVINSIPLKEDVPVIAELNINTKPMTTKESSTEPTQPRQLDPLAAIPSSLTEIDQTLEKISSIMGGISESLYASDLTNPLGYRLARIAAWLPVEKAPPAQENQTMIPPPNSQLLDALTSLQNDQANEDIVRFAETQLQRNPYWLDLNRICAEALNRIGALDAQREVTAATQHFSKRVPEITGLFFSNGMSFADAQTLTWLENQDGTETNNANEKYLQNAIRTARSMALDGNLGEAADFLQKQLNQTTSLRDKLLLRVSLCELLLTQHPAGNLLPFAIAIIADIDRFQLTEWDPVLAIKGLKAAYLVMSRNNGDIKEANKLLAKIIQLDAGSAVRLII